MNNPGKIILVADDDFDDLEMLEEVFLKIEKNAIVHTVSCGKEVLAFLTGCHAKDLPCLIVLDYNMPDLTGAQLTELISSNEAYKHIPLLVWSTSNSPVYKRECELKGAREYFYKPNDFGQVIEMARQMLVHCDEIKLTVK